ncbi:MAG: class I SAM-dependent methyltransferase [Lewinella sp.]|nr:class I SAM-dependent methyltransferase [Lewinella sp.]
MKSAAFYNAIYGFKDYEGASARLHTLIQENKPGAGTLLDVGCGTGLHLKYLRKQYEVAGLDISPELLAVARESCPDIPFHEADMTDFELNRTFDVVICLFSAIAYVKTLANLERAMTQMARHLQPGGLLIVEPWVSPEKYWRNHIVANFVDQPDLKISWMYNHDIEDSVSVFNINYLVGTPQGVEYFTERHEMGLFTHEQYLAAFGQAGLHVEYDEKGLFGRGMYLGVKEEIIS